MITIKFYMKNVKFMMSRQKKKQLIKKKARDTNLCFITCHNMPSNKI